MMLEIVKRKEEIQLLIASNNLQKAIKRSMDFVRDFSDDRSMMRRVFELNATLSEQKDKTEDFNPVIYELLELLDAVANNKV